VEKQHIVKALQFELSKVETQKVRQRMLGHLEKINGVLAAQVAKAIGEKAGSSPNPKATSKGTADKPDELAILENATTPTTASGGLLKTKGLSMEVGQPKLAKGRKVAILVADGTATAEIVAMKTALDKAKVLSEIVAPCIGEVKGDGGTVLATKTYANSSSVLFDAVYVPGGEASIGMLKEIPDALHFVDEAYKHGKAIAATGAALELIGETTCSKFVPDAATGAPQGVFLAPTPDKIGAKFIEAIANHRFHNRQVDKVLG
jgi:catalase